ncbi:MAG: aminopeptidase, partial [Deltaproteobacteria bacterium]|nr:aminopeptidase [Deltaproteobacteria bacterium]
RRPIEEVLRRPDLDTATREKLELVLRVRRFAEQELGFRVSGSYSSLTEVASPPIVHVVTAALRTSLEPYTWWFPIIGRVAYKGYFDRDAAKHEAERLEAQGYDTYVRTAVAFSTLGWFSDPLLPQLLRYDQETLANIIIHELFHSTFYLSGETALNESLANFAGHRGAIAFFAKEQGSETAAARHAVATWESELTVSNFLAKAAERLNALYASPVSEAEKLHQREELFARLQEEFRSLPGPVRQNTDFASVKLNNAVVLQYLVYLKELALFERVYQQNGKDLRVTLARITAAAKKEDDPFAGVRAIASDVRNAFGPALVSFGDWQDRRDMFTESPAAGFQAARMTIDLWSRTWALPQG